MWGDAARHRASVFWREHAAVPDAMILTAWRAPGCEQVVTEDPNHRHVLDGITIINPVRRDGSAVGAQAIGSVAKVKIVSLLPSATEIICALGLGDDLVGVTHECDHPASALAPARSIASMPRP